MNWKVWLAKKLNLKAELEKAKIIEHNNTLRFWMLKAIHAEEELKKRTSFFPMACNFCKHNFTPKEPTGPLEQAEQHTDPTIQHPVQGIRDRARWNEFKQQHGPMKSFTTTKLLPIPPKQ